MTVSVQQCLGLRCLHLLTLQVQKELALKSYVNKKFEQPYQTALYTSSVIQEVKRWHVAEYEAVIGELSKADLEVHSILYMF